jgi:hypothetical protein
LNTPVLEIEEALWSVVSDRGVVSMRSLYKMFPQMRQHAVNRAASVLVAAGKCEFYGEGALGYKLLMNAEGKTPGRLIGN